MISMSLVKKKEKDAQENHPLGAQGPASHSPLGEPPQSAIIIESEWISFPSSLSRVGEESDVSSGRILAVAVVHETTASITGVAHMRQMSQSGGGLGLSLSPAENRHSARSSARPPRPAWHSTAQFTTNSLHSVWSMMAFISFAYACCPVIYVELHSGGRRRYETRSRRSTPARCVCVLLSYSMHTAWVDHPPAQLSQNSLLAR